MKQFNKMLASALLILVLATTKLLAQTAPTTPPADGEYRSTGAVNFTLATNWEMASGGTWSAAAVAPNGTKTITIQSTTTLTVDQPVTVTGYIKNAGTIALVAATSSSTTTTATTTGSNTVTLTAANASLAVGQILNAPTGTAFPAGVQVTGISGTSLTLSQTALGAITSSFAYSFYSNYLTFSTGTYEHAQDGGAFPISVWGATSTCLITGVVATAPGTNATSCQNFGNFTWDCTGQTTASLTMAWAGITIQGNITIKNTGTTGVGSGNSAGSIRLTSANPLNNANITAVPITINGDLIIGTTTTKANVSTSGSGGLQIYNITVKGNVSVGTAAFGGSTWGMAGGSGGPAIITLTGTNGNGDFIVAGTSSTLTANNATKVIFAKAGTQAFSYPIAASVGLVTWEVSNGTTLNLGSQIISGGGCFNMNAGSTLISSISTFSGGNIQTTNKVINAGANFILNGSAAQTLAFPSTSGTVAYSYATAAFPIGATNIILSVANSNILVGQSITGVNIPAGATVSAISGTSLTLSTALTTAVATNTALTFTGATITKQTINNLIISNTAASPGVTISTIPVTVNGTLSFGSVNSSTLTTGSNLVIGSSLAGTGRIADITNAGVNTGNVITGTVTVERYIPVGNRAFRLLSPSVTTTSFIKANWQEGATSSTSNPVAGYGTHITGSTVDQTNGFDGTLTGNASLYQFSNSGQTWSSIANTNATVLTAGNAYRILIRGNRALDLTVASSPTSTATTLRATGTLLTGSVILNSTGTGATVGMPILSNTVNQFSLIGNPYASPVDWHTVTKTNISTTYYAWDPNMTGANNRGAYVSYDVTTGFNNLGNTGSSAVNRYIQPGQAVFVKTTSASPVLTFKEIDKQSTFTNVFRTNTVNSHLTALLYKSAEIAAGKPSDGVTIVFDNQFSNAVGLGDVDKMENPDENISVLTNNTKLSIDARNIVTNEDTVWLNISQMNTAASYVLRASAEDMGNVAAYLHDNFNGSSTLLNASANTDIPFSITSNPSSFSTNRFYIFFKTSGALPVSITSLKAFQKNTGVQVEWNTANEVNMSSYEVEKSADGTSFNKAGTLTATGSSAYNWFDASPLSGKNYYRIKMIDKNGAAWYTQVVNVKIGGSKNTFTVVGNPVKNKTITLQMEGVEKGSYIVAVFNNLGQQVASKTINHAGGSATETVALGNVANGTYQLSITSSSVKETRTIIVE